MSSRVAYRWAAGARVVRGLRASTAQKAIEAIRASNGGKVNAEDVVRAAASQTHPLHRAFEWSDRKAAAEYRLTQARLLIRSIVVVVEDVGPVREYVHVQVGREDGSYQRTSDALASEAERDSVLARCKADLRSWKERYERFVACSEIVAKVGRLLCETEPEAKPAKRKRKAG